MKTKAQIVQQLLNDGKINAEDAVVLLTNSEKEKEYIFVPQNIPYSPNPFWQIPNYQNPYTITCGTGKANTSNNFMIN